MGVKEMKREKFDKTQQTETKGIEIKRQYNNLPSKSRDTHQRQNRANSVSPLNNNESVIFLCKSYLKLVERPIRIFLYIALLRYRMFPTTKERRQRKFTQISSMHRIFRSSFDMPFFISIFFRPSAFLVHTPLLNEYHNHALILAWCV